MEIMTLAEKKPTRATLKSFIAKHKTELFILCESRFDGMTDCIQEIEQAPHRVTLTNEYLENTLGINGVWLVGSSRDWIKPFEDGLFRGYKVSNSCGSFILGIIK